MGDRILKVNGTDVTSATHQEAVTELLRAADEIKLTIQHDPLPVGFQVSDCSFIQHDKDITLKCSMIISRNEKKILGQLECCI